MGKKEVMRKKVQKHHICKHTHTQKDCILCSLFILSIKHYKPICVSLSFAERYRSLVQAEQEVHPTVLESTGAVVSVT